MTPGMATILPELCRYALQAGLTAVLQSTLLLAVGLLTAAALRRRGPVLQSLVYKAFLVSTAWAVLLAIPFARHLTPLWRIGLPAAGATVPYARPVAQNLPLTGWLAGSYVAAAGVWSVVAVFMLVHLAFSHLYVLRLRSRSAPVGEGQTMELLCDLCGSLGLSPPRLVACAGVETPFLAGLWCPAILLPASYETDFDSEELRAILAHELIHLVRCDCGWNLFARVACAFGWIQPLLWWLCRRLEECSEEVCDQAVIERYCPPRAYASCLLDLAERYLPRRPECTAGIGVVPSRSSLGWRIQLILAGPRARPLSVPLRAGVLIGSIATISGAVFFVSAAIDPGPTAGSIRGVTYPPGLQTNTAKRLHLREGSVAIRDARHTGSAPSRPPLKRAGRGSIREARPRPPWLPWRTGMPPDGTLNMPPDRVLDEHSLR